MNFNSFLIQKYNEVFPEEVIGNHDLDVEEVIARFMLKTKPNQHATRIKYLAAAHSKALSECVIDDDYDENVLPVRRAINFSLNELLIFFNGEVDSCKSFIAKQFIGENIELPLTFQDFLETRVKHCVQDKLSLILEGQDMCAALSIIESKILIATNSIHLAKDREQVTPKRYHEYLKKTMEYFVGDPLNSQHKSGIFRDVCKQRLARERRNGLIVPDELCHYIADELLHDPNDWLNRSPRVTMHRLGENNLYYQLNVVLNVYSILNSTVGYFNAIGSELAGFRYEIIAPEGFSHAEMKVIDHVLENVMFRNCCGLRQTYIAISKLCCADCEKSIEALNAAVKNIHKISLISYCSQSSRAGHGQKFKKWTKPRFLDADITKWHPEVQMICERSRECYVEIEKRVDKSAKSWENMYATESSDSE